MVKNIRSEIFQDLESENPVRLKFTRQAFHLLPELTRPRILDVGCGQGLPTLELASLSQARVIGVDVDEAALGRLVARARQAGLGDRVRVVRGSMLKLDFPDESFDLIWSEGAIFIIGFEAGLKAWRRFIKPHGYCVVHEMTWLRPAPPSEIASYWQQRNPDIRTAAEYIAQLPACGYKLVDHFPLPEEVWWLDYYGPLAERLTQLRLKYAEDRAVQQLLDQEQREIELYQKYSPWYGSAFYVMQKRD